MLLGLEPAGGWWWGKHKRASLSSMGGREEQQKRDSGTGWQGLPHCIFRSSRSPNFPLLDNPRFCRSAHIPGSFLGLQDSLLSFSDLITFSPMQSQLPVGHLPTRLGTSAGLRLKSGRQSICTVGIKEAKCILRPHAQTWHAYGPVKGLLSPWLRMRV